MRRRGMGDASGVALSNIAQENTTVEAGRGTPKSSIKRKIAIAKSPYSARNCSIILYIKTVSSKLRVELLAGLKGIEIMSLAEKTKKEHHIYLGIYVRGYKSGFF